MDWFLVITLLSAASIVAVRSSGDESERALIRVVEARQMNLRRRLARHWME